MIDDLRSIVTHTLAHEGPNGPNGAVTQYILAAAERHLHDGLRSALGSTSSPGEETSLLSRLLPLEGFGPDVLDISRNNLRRRWATASDWLDDVIAYALRPGRADEHARAAVSAATGMVGRPLGELISAVTAGEVAAERDPARFGLAEMIRTMWPDHPAVRSARTTLDEYALHWWVPVYSHILDVYGLALIDGLKIEDFARPLLALVEHEARAQSPGHAARAIVVLISGAVIDTRTGSRLTPAEVTAHTPPDAALPQPGEEALDDNG